ncbi:P protein-like [Anastrepha obliqua]|uniref:P protein-like n=1 Tax=Anastrepha obliqua TaxID=95512 RepID=UPI002408F8B1|nr:P protein-like [Anastrepha obliqua]
MSVTFNTQSSSSSSSSGPATPNDDSSTFAATSNLRRQNARERKRIIRRQTGLTSVQVRDEKRIPDDLDTSTPFQTRILLLLASKDGINITVRALLSNITTTFLLILWTVVILLMARNKIRPDESRMFILEPDKLSTYDIPHDQIGDEIGIVMHGPFEETNIYAEDKEVEKETVTMNIVSVDNNNAKLSDDWYVYLLPGDPELQRTVKNLHVFPLSTKLSSEEKQQLQLSMTTTKQVTIKLRVDAYYANRKYGVLSGAFVLILMYAMIITEVIERTLASVFCATLAVSLLTTCEIYISISTIMSWVDVETLLMLFSMMILIALLSDSGIFDFFAVYAYKLSKGRIWPLLTSLCLITAVLSAFLDNVTMMLLIAPVVIKLCEALQLDPVHLLTFMIIYSNIGAASTPIGDPPNIIITNNEFIRLHGVHFGNFMLHCVPCVILVIIQTYCVLRFMFKDETKLRLHESIDDSLKRLARQSVRLNSMASMGSLRRQSQLSRQSERILMKVKRRKERVTASYNSLLEELQSEYGIKDMSLLVKISIAFVFTLLLFFSHGIHGLHQLSLAWAALVGALLAFVLINIDDFPSLLQRVEWSTLIFFASLFIIMEVLIKNGLIGLIGEYVQDVLLLVDGKYRLLVAVMLILWVSAITSAFFVNIPVTAMMVPIVITLSQDQNLQLPLHPLVWALALGACFGGNGTLIAASANVVTAGIATQRGYKFSFMAFFVMGFPIMLGNIVVASIYLILCHVVFQWHDPPKYD